jgi:hypothetical protein
MRGRASTRGVSLKITIIVGAVVAALVPPAVLGIGSLRAVREHTITTAMERISRTDTGSRRTTA